MPECQGTPCSKQSWYLKFKWLQRNSYPQSLCSSTKIQPFSHFGHITELCCEYVSVQHIWLYVPVMSRPRFRVNSVYSCLNVKELVSRNRNDIWSLSDCNGTLIHNHLVRKRTLNHLPKLAKWLSYVVSIICTVHLNAYCSHFLYRLLALQPPSFFLYHFNCLVLQIYSP